LDDIPENDSLEVWSEVVTAVPPGQASDITTFKIEGGFPNPFNAQTNFILQTPRLCEVRIDLFGTQGRKLSSYNYGMLTMGKHILEINAENLPSGLYIARIHAGKWIESRKVVLLK
jgi:hypothetical protein